jgi:hypothetical protein
VPRGAIERFVMQALRRAIEDPTPGYGVPKLKMCATCFEVNRKAMTKPREKIELRMHYQTRPTVLEEPEKVIAAKAGMFSHLVEQVEVPKIEPKRVSPLVEVCPGLFVGSDEEWLHDTTNDQAYVIGAAKEPWHREMLGYKTKSAPEGPQRLVARNGSVMALNLIDVRELGPGEHCYIPDEVIDQALAFIEEGLSAGRHVVIHDPQGTSSAPGIAFLYMHDKGLVSKVGEFKEIYKSVEPHAGMKEYIRRRLEGVSHEAGMALSA